MVYIRGAKVVAANMQDRNIRNSHPSKEKWSLNAIGRIDCLAQNIIETYAYEVIIV
jgi:hypothetical protein